MKITQDQEFRPITIVLESALEVRDVLDILEHYIKTTSNGGSMSDNMAIDISNWLKRKVSP